MKEFVTTPIPEEELNKAAGGVTVGSPVLGNYKCYNCGCRDFHVLYAQTNSVRVQCKNCGKESTINEN